MVIRPILCAAILIIPALADAKSPQDQMFPGAGSCYARSYTADHLASHPAQRVIGMVIRPDFASSDRFLTLHLTVNLRGVPGGAFEAYAYCENEGADTLYCAMEGDAGGFQITPAKGGAILISVSSLGMGFENDTGFATLDRNTGDDRSFILRPATCR
jgi:hypothetical protein